MKKNNKGFTLAEMLIVVAIIGVLIAILVPTFSAQLQKAKIAADQANIRSKMAEYAADYLSESTSGKTYEVTITADSLTGSVGGSSLPEGLAKGDVVTFSMDTETNKVTISEKSK